LDLQVMAAEQFGQAALHLRKRFIKLGLL
jgi:hypothetical protein